jgi:ubiquinone/menaquinone biosynthesis C-methylase UbiE
MARHDDNASQQTAAEHWNERYSGPEHAWSGQPNVALVDVVGALPPHRAIDLGCGEGADALWLAEQGWQVTGVDVSVNAIDRAKAEASSRGLTGLKWLVTDVADWEPEPASADLVTASFLHSKAPLDRDDALRKAARAVASGGHIFVLAHATTPPWARHSHFAHAALPTLDEELQLLTSEGDWTQVVAEVRRRTVTGPDGEPAELDDLIVLLKRA